MITTLVEKWLATTLVGGAPFSADASTTFFKYRWRRPFSYDIASYLVLALDVCGMPLVCGLQGFVQA